MAHYDMLVIGSGPAGQKAAIQAAKIGKKVGIIERKKVAGGICINSGTIPSKSLREAVLFLSGFRQRNLYGASYRVKKDITLEDLAQRCDHVVRGRAGNHPEPADSELRRFHRRAHTQWRSLRNRRRPLPGDRSRPNHRRYRGHAKTALPQRE